MAVLIVENVMEVRVQYSLGSTSVSNTYFVRRPSLTSFAAAVGDAAAPFSAYISALLVAQSTTLVAETITFIDRDSDLQAILTTTVGEPGLDPNVILPRQTAVVISWRTLYTGPRNRGRTYLTGFTEAVNDAAGTPSGGMLATVQAAADDLISDLDTEGLELVVVSRGQEPDPDADPPIVGWEPYATTVATATVDNRWKTQRRRALEG